MDAVIHIGMHILVWVIMLALLVATLATAASIVVGPLLIGRALAVRSNLKKAAAKNPHKKIPHDPRSSFRLPVLVCVVPISTLVTLYGVAHLLSRLTLE